jgi:putative phosphoribosyl transferase
MRYPQRFADRAEAGRLLALRLMRYAKRSDVLVLGLPRGGVPVAYEVAQTLKVPMDIIVVRKLGVPGHEELAMGAIASGGIRVLYDEVVRDLHIPDSVIDAVAEYEQHELERRERLYREGRSPLSIANRSVILVDDGLATGTSMHAAVNALRPQKPARLIVAIPVAPPSTCLEFEASADEVVCLITPEPFFAVGGWYVDFGQTTDEEVCNVLARTEKWV